MTDALAKINTEKLAARLKELQTEFKSYNGLSGYLKAKPLSVDFEVNKDNIIIGCYLNKDSSCTVSLKTKYECSVLTGLEVSEIEVDSYSYGTYLMDYKDSDLLLQCKRIIHDAVHYKILDEDSEIKTNFYSEVYA